MEHIKQMLYTGERPLFRSRGLRVEECTFTDGESPLKESRDLELARCKFGWKYPLWYCKNVSVEDSTWEETARAGVWYTDGIRVKGCNISAPKTFRRCRGIEIEDTDLPNAQETLWNCSDVKLRRVKACGDYFGMNCENLEAEGLTLHGNYAFDGAKNVVVRGAELLSKDAFWNSENVTVYDSFISGEYLGWNAKNLTLIGCTIESLQGLCYIENLVMRACKLQNTTLAFEYSTVDAQILSRIDSVIDPAGGVIEAEEIGELILRPAYIDPSKTVFRLKRR